MTLAGWIVMLRSVGGTTAFFWCIRHVLRPPGSTGKIHGVLDTEFEIEEEDRKRRLEGQGN